MKFYVAGPMRGKPDFNFPAFNSVTRFLRGCGHVVFNPAARDVAEFGDVFKSPTGDPADIAVENFSLRDALAADMKFIAEEADAIWMLEGWETSLGAQAEWALARALGHKIFYDSDIGDLLPEAGEPALA